MRNLAGCGIVAFVVGCGSTIQIDGGGGEGGFGTVRSTGAATKSQGPGSGAQTSGMNTTSVSGPTTVGPSVASVGPSSHASVGVSVASVGPSSATVGPSAVTAGPVGSSGSGFGCDSGMMGDPDGLLCQKCVDCAVDGVCSAVLQACLQSPSCVQYDECVRNCGEPMCLAQCQAQFPQGALEYQSVITCVLCDVCPTNCNAGQFGC